MRQGRDLSEQGWEAIMRTHSFIRRTLERFCRQVLGRLFKAHTESGISLQHERVRDKRFSWVSRADKRLELTASSTSNTSIA